MRSFAHVLVACGLGITSVSFLLTFILTHASIWVLWIGILGAFLTGLEGANFLTSKRQWNTGYESPKQRNLKGIGTLLSYTGVLLAIYGLVEFSNTLVGCLASGCTPSMLLEGYWAMFYLGLALVAAGAVLMFWSKFVSVSLKLPELQKPALQRQKT